MESRDYYEIRIYIGSENSKTGYPIYEFSLEKIIGEAQEEHEKVIPVRITKTTYVSGVSYKERGWEIAAINYPKISATTSEIKEFMMKLGRTFLEKCGQKRVCVVNSVDNKIIMLEGDKDG